ncbi:hypothetical protein M422DRAFT_245209 [Sphaerobolus stellatus SS14]|nr:hypothetical protein M422DRAFT_245209 [Sphaerobolus stellatus SS14]
MSSLNLAAYRSGVAESSQAGPSRTRKDTSRSSCAMSTGRSGEDSRNSMGIVPGSNATELQGHTSDSSVEDPETHNSDSDSSIPDSDQTPESGSDDSSPSNDNAATRPFQKKKMRGGIMIASQNMRGGRSAASRNKWTQIDQLIRDRSIGILALQETHIDSGHLDDISRLFERQLHIVNSHDPDSPASKGVAFIINKKHIAWKDISSTEIIPGRAILINVPWKTEDNEGENILNVYAPNSPTENSNFWAEIKRIWCQKRLARPHIMLGDFNLVEDSADRKSPHPDNGPAVNNLQSLKNYFHLQDGWHRTHPDTLAYTYMQGITHSRINRIYTTEKMYKFSFSMKFLNPSAPYQGKGRWAIPPFMLQSSIFIDKVAEMGMALQEKLKTNQELDIQVKYRNFKISILKMAKTQAIKKACAIQTIIAKKSEKLNETTMNPLIPEEEKQLIMTFL